MRIVLTSCLALLLLPCGAPAVQEHERADQKRKERQAKVKKQVEEVNQKAVKERRQVAARQRERSRVQRQVERQVERERKSEPRRSVRRRIEKEVSEEASRFRRRGEGEGQTRNERAHREHAEEWSSLLRGVKERRPELAKRLDEILKDNPKHFEDVLMRALMGQIESAIEREDRGWRGRSGRSATTPREPTRARCGSTRASASSS